MHLLQHATRVFRQKLAVNLVVPAKIETAFFCGQNFIFLRENKLLDKNKLLATGCWILH